MTDLNSISKLSLLIDLSYLKGFEGDLRDFEEELNILDKRELHFEMSIIFKVLREKKILMATTKRGEEQLYTLDIKKLCLLIEEQTFVKKLYRYFDYLH